MNIRKAFFKIEVNRMDVNQKQLAKILGLTDRHIRRLRDEYGLFQKVDGKRTYTLESCVPEYLEFKLEEAGKVGSSFNKEKQLAEHEEIKKKISMLKLRKLRGQLHEAADVESFLTDMLSDFRNKLLALPQKITPLLIGEDDSNVIMSLLEKEIFTALSELSEYDPMQIDGNENTEELLEESEDEEEEDN